MENIILGGKCGVALYGALVFLSFQLSILCLSDSFSVCRADFIFLHKTGYLQPRCPGLFEWRWLYSAFEDYGFPSLFLVGV